MSGRFNAENLAKFSVLETCHCNVLKHVKYVKEIDLGIYIVLDSSYLRNQFKHIIILDDILCILPITERAK